MFPSTLNFLLRSVDVTQVKRRAVSITLEFVYFMYYNLMAKMTSNKGEKWPMVSKRLII